MENHQGDVAVPGEVATLSLFEDVIHFCICSGVAVRRKFASHWVQVQWPYRKGTKRISMECIQERWSWLESYSNGLSYADKSVGLWAIMSVFTPFLSFTRPPTSWDDRKRSSFETILFFTCARDPRTGGPKGQTGVRHSWWCDGQSCLVMS